MAFFKEAPIKSLTRDRDLAKANCDRLALKLHEAEANVIATKSLAQRAALDGDDGVASMLPRPLSGPRCTGTAPSARHMPNLRSCWRFWNRSSKPWRIKSCVPRPVSRPSHWPTS
jgi:hypothetical protein